MKFEGRERSRNVEDRRGSRRTASKVGGGIGLGTLLIAGIVYFLGGNPIDVLQQAAQQSQNSPQTIDQPYQESEEEEILKELVDVTLKDTEDVWNKIFREQLSQRYVEPKLIVFAGSTNSACGFAKAATGPFYCPADQDVYIDLDFYNQLRQKFKVSGDFAMAYVIAHEVGHHVQNLLGITSQVHAQKGQLVPEDYNNLSVRMELQADFLAGVWAHHAHKMKDILERGDIQEAMDAAHAIGDDNIQKRSRGYVVPESFTHGTSAQRMRWFKKGLETGDIRQGDTFNTHDI
jgi:predicted metalloprotease